MYDAALVLPHLDHLTRQCSCVGSGVGDEAVSIRHFHFRHRLGVQNLALTNDAVKIQDVSSNGIHFTWGKGARLLLRHRSIDIVPHTSCIGPVTADGDQRRVAFQRPQSACYRRILSVPFSMLTMATRAPRDINVATLSCRPFAWRQPRAGRKYRNITSSKFFWSWSLPQIMLSALRQND